MNKKIRIKSFELSSEIFDKILYDYSSVIKQVKSTDEYIYGYKNKHDIYYDGREYIICRECIVNYYCGGKLIDNVTNWKQCRVRRVENMNINVNKTIDGQTAWEFMIKLLKHWYTYDEIKETMSHFEADYSEDLKQYHYNVYNLTDKILKYENCYKYDINGAHCDALTEIFPKAAKSIIKLYEERHINPNNKALVNYFVGMLKHKGFDKTYNWIVQRTTKILFKAMDYTKGICIYANTDGYIVYKPEKLLKTNTKLGEFKLEYFGDVYVYNDRNYNLIQYGNEMKGSCLESVRNMIDLRKGQVVHYNKVEKPITENTHINIAKNIIKDIKEIL